MDTKNWASFRWYSRLRWDLEVVIANDYQPLDAGVTMLRMFAELHTCPAQTELGFRRWAMKFIRDSHVEQKLHDARARLRIDEIALIRPAIEEPFVTELHPSKPGVTCVQINQKRTQYVWLVPTAELPKAESLWGGIEVRSKVIARQRTPYLVKLCRRETYAGSWMTEPIPLAEIWFNREMKDLVFEDGSLLNFAEKNVTVIERQIRTSPLDERKATRDAMFAQPVARVDKPANPAHERKVRALLFGQDSADEPSEAEKSVVDIQNSWKVFGRK